MIPKLISIRYQHLHLIIIYFPENLENLKTTDWNAKDHQIENHKNQNNYFKYNKFNSAKQLNTESINMTL